MDCIDLLVKTAGVLLEPGCGAKSFALVSRSVELVSCWFEGGAIGGSHAAVEFFVSVDRPAFRVSGGRFDLFRVENRELE
ncbi:hypothetical protein GCM10023318_23160 [Nocardia callitridis]|uniref:Uncharacterized protein n=1 Tax=Nocardia callitridis TaxID=648753 RepID=A0ABP9K8L4_9NOCA